MKKYKKWDHTKVVRVFLLLFLDIILVNLSSFLALFTRMELDITALQRAGFLLSVRRYALIDTVCTILIFWLFRLYNSLWAYAGTNELTRIAVASIISASIKYLGMYCLSLPIPKSFPVLDCLFLMAFVGATVWLSAISVMRYSAGGKQGARSALCSSAPETPAPSHCWNVKTAGTPPTRWSASSMTPAARRDSCCGAFPS